MAKVKYKPDPGQSDETSQFGYNFAGGKSVDVTDERQLAKFRGNRFFEVSGDDAKEAPAGSQQSPAAIESQMNVQKQDAEKTGNADLRAVHRGRGSYSVMRGDSDQEVLPDLTKADAEAFNALSDEDKRAYVETAETK